MGVATVYSASPAFVEILSMLFQNSYIQHYPGVYYIKF